MDVRFGVNVDPDAGGFAQALEIARRADRAGLDLIGVQDHPYQHRFLDTLALIATLLARTERISVFPNVANLPLRPPAMLAKEAASLDVMSGGRFELGLGAGAFWDGVAAMGGPRRTPGESVAALEEAIQLIRMFWKAEGAVRIRGRHYTVEGARPGPPPAHRIQVWIGAYKPRMLALTGRLGDGWIPSLGYLPPDRVPEARARLEEAALAAERRPEDIRRIYNVSGRTGDPGTVETLAGFIRELGFDTLVFWPLEDHLRELDRFAGEVVPAVREMIARP